MAKCSKCGFVIVTELLAGHEFLCGGKVRETPELPEFPDIEKVGDTHCNTDAEDWWIYWELSSEAWEARCRLAVKAMYHAQAMANGQAHNSIEEFLRSILLKIWPLPEEQPLPINSTTTTGD